MPQTLREIKVVYLVLSTLSFLETKAEDLYRVKCLPSSSLLCSHQADTVPRHQFGGQCFFKLIIQKASWQSQLSYFAARRNINALRALIMSMLYSAAIYIGSSLASSTTSYLLYFPKRIRLELKF